ncbi:putative lytic murein transglycosylase [Nitratireductor pacificus pht-3B]|uniref:Putative lytic murein transglycosylase n=1 Tax=Nitratireductor pacificus pht-3B TaxID=391937 RepID=K2LRH9_9HYPH|nr:putative lytic murein transglycosylase [Nitratireductor pacificus pht-3B]
MTTAVTPLCPAGHLPLKGGDRAVEPSVLIVSEEALRCHQPISPLEGEMPGRAEGGIA